MEKTKTGMLRLSEVRDKWDEGSQSSGEGGGIKTGLELNKYGAVIDENDKIRREKAAYLKKLKSNPELPKPQHLKDFEA